MKHAWMLVAALALTLGACDKLGKGSVKIDSDEQKVSYAIGQQIGNNLKADGVEADPNVVAAAISDVLKGEKARVEQGELMAAMQRVREKVMNKQREEAQKNLGASASFLEENKKKAGVKTTASGLQYEVVTEGQGTAPKDSDVVKVHYKGTLVSGQEFDSSYSRNQPAEFPVNGVIPGWTEALKLMKSGAKYKLVIPPNLAYGEAGRPGIPPNSVLLFEVELLEVKTAAKEQKKGKG